MAAISVLLFIFSACGSNSTTGIRTTVTGSSPEVSTAGFADNNAGRKESTASADKRKDTSAVVEKDIIPPCVRNDTGKTVIRKAFPEYATYFIISKAGTVIVADPCGEIGVPQNIKADIITVSHSHSDHSDFQYIASQKCKVIDKEAEDITEKDVKISSIGSAHGPDATKGGSNIIYIFEVDGIRIAHMGDIGQAEFSGEQLDKLGRIDVAIVPCTEMPQYGLEAKNTAKLMKQLKPQIILSGHNGSEAAVADESGIPFSMESEVAISPEDLKKAERKVILLSSAFDILQ